jgi:flagellar biosynthesis/type III secretory pathway protein FliH
MLMNEWKLEDALVVERAEGREEGLAEGWAKGQAEGRAEGWAKAVKNLFVRKGLIPRPLGRLKRY